MQALSIDAALLRPPRAARLRGVVHSVFERVVNVQGEDGALFTVASRDLDNAPDTLVADTASFTTTGVARGDRVDAVEGAIAIEGRVAIRLDGAKAWQASLPRYPADDSRLRENLQKMHAWLGPEALGGASPRGAASQLARGMAAMLEWRAGLLLAALRAGDVRAAGRHGRAMVGLGPGLTPSGDDFLVGPFAVLHVPHGPSGHLAGVCDRIIVDMEQRTNAISVAALRAASRGRVRETIQALVRELMQGSTRGLAAALARVLAIGSSSGTDIAAGILCGFELAAAQPPVGSAVSCLHV